MGVNPKARANKAQVAEEAARCLELQLSGMSYRRIAETTGLSLGTIQNRLNTAYAAIVVPGVNEMRTREGERLLLLLDRLQPAVDQGDQNAIRTAMRISESYRRLYGLNAPEQHHVQFHEVTQSDLALQEMIRAARARAALDTPGNRTT